ncbi:MAG: hypothetical protein CEE43_13735 [Promethearchaeota archaeon Loki_b32]|nr:MAG: hypothetical protein CEE43_13735 [Candidatus Lokiarchaeota archaeon Loki_b32]
MTKETLNKFLIDIIENSSDEKKRYDSLEALQKNFYNLAKYFTFLENLLISDLNPKIRIKAAELLVHYFLPKSLNPIKWALQNDNSIECVIKYTEIIKEYNEKFLFQILISEIEQYFNKYKQFHSKLENFVFYNQDLDDLIEILLNYKILNKMITIFPNLKKENNFVKIYGGKIRHLELTNKNIKKIIDIEGLDLLTNLEDLNLSYNDISEIIGLNNLTKLQNLNLSHNKISKIENLENLTELHSLNLGFNKIEKLTGIKDMKKLINLNLMHNKIKNFDDLTQLQSLETINLSKNLIYKINGLDNLMKLKALDLTFNNIKDISKPDKYKNKIKLLLYGNPFNTYDPGL